MQTLRACHSCTLSSDSEDFVHILSFKNGRAACVACLRVTEASGLHAACLCSVFPRQNPALEAGFGRVICAQKGCSIRVEQGLPASTAGTVCFRLMPGPNHDHCGISTNTGFKPASINVGRIGVGVLEWACRILPMSGCAVREGKGCDCPGGKSLKLSGLRLTPRC